MMNLKNVFGGFCLGCAMCEASFLLMHILMHVRSIRMRVFMRTYQLLLDAVESKR